MSASGPPSGEYTFIIERPQEASPQRKRPRTLTACDKCRLRKVKCDPIPDTRQCESCKGGGFICTFQERTRRQIEGLDVLDAPEKPSTSKPRSPSVSERAQSLLTNSIKPRPSSSRPRPTPRPHSQLITGSPLSIASPSSDFSLSPLSLSPSSGVPFSASPPSRSPLALAAGNPLTLSTSPQRLFDKTNPLSPRPEHLAELIQTFSSHFSCFFPFFRLEDTMQMAREGRLLLHKSLGMAALASRFSTFPDFVLEPRFQFATAYLNVARSQLGNWIGEASVEMLQGFLILACAECGNRNITKEQGQSEVSAADWSAQYLQEAVRIARSLGLGWSSKLANVGVPREEALATWWTLLLMDELIAWANDRPAFLTQNDFDHPLPRQQRDTHLIDVFPQLVALSHQRRKVGRATFSGDAGQAPAQMNEIFDAMAATYGERVKVWPELAFAQNNFQIILQGPSGPTQATLYIAFHAVHYSAIFKFRARSRSSPIQDSDNDLAAKSAKNVLSLATWSQKSGSPQTFNVNLFLEQSLYNSGQAFSLARRRSEDPDAYVNEMETTMMVLTHMAKYWYSAYSRRAYVIAQHQAHQRSASQYSHPAILASPQPHTPHWTHHSGTYATSSSYPVAPNHHHPAPWAPLGPQHHGRDPSTGTSSYHSSLNSSPAAEWGQYTSNHPTQDSYYQINK